MDVLYVKPNIAMEPRALKYFWVWVWYYTHRLIFRNFQGIMSKLLNYFRKHILKSSESSANYNNSKLWNSRFSLELRKLWLRKYEIINVKFSPKDAWIRENLNQLRITTPIWTFRQLLSSVWRIWKNHLIFWNTKAKEN